MKSAEMIGWAIGGLEREIVATRDRLAALTAQANTLRSRLPRSRSGAAAAAAAAAASTGEAGPVAGDAGTRKRKRKKMSREARKRISDAMTKRWAERRKASK